MNKQCGWCKEKAIDMRLVTIFRDINNDIHGLYQCEKCWRIQVLSKNSKPSDNNDFMAQAENTLCPNCNHPRKCHNDCWYCSICQGVCKKEPEPKPNSLDVYTWFAYSPEGQKRLKELGFIKS